MAIHAGMEENMNTARMRIWMVWLLSGLPFCAFAADQEISVELLGESEKVIPIYYQYGDLWISNIKLPAMAIANRSAQPAQVGKIAVVGKSAGKEVLRNTVDAEAVGAELARFGKALNQLIADPGKRYLLNSRYGRVRVPGRPYAEGLVLQPGETSAVNLFTLLKFQFCGKDKLDDVSLQVEVTIGGAVQTIEFPVPLTPYRCRGNYRFPIRGACTIGSLPLGFIHRGAHSQEFAIDILDLRRIAAGSFSTSTKIGDGERRVVQTSAHAEDYFIFDREVRAAADGVVAAMENRFPDQLASNPQENFIERLNRLTPRLLQDGVSQRNISAGNYVVIDHRNGEFSYYCHLRENISVKAGDKVAKGQVIARVGNSGNSTEPHLHFQLMDGEDFATANGLPVVFEDLNLETAIDSPFFGERNSLLYSEFIFTFTE